MLFGNSDSEICNLLELIKRTKIILSILHTQMTEISDAYSRKSRPAVKNRREKISSYVWDHPSCSYSDIYKHSGATKNYKDFKDDIDYLVLADNLIRTMVTRKFFKEPIKNGSQGVFLIYQMLDNWVNFCKCNPGLQKTKIFRQINHMAPQLTLSNIGKITDTYKHGIDQTKQDDQLLSKVMIILFQKTRIFTSENKRLENIYKIMKSKLSKNHKTQQYLLQKEMILLNEDGKIDNTNFAKKRKIRNQRRSIKTIHDLEWENFVQLSKRVDGSLACLNLFAELLKLFFKIYVIDPKYLSSSNVNAGKISAFLDQEYDEDKAYNSTLRSPHMRSLKELVEILNYIYLGCDKNTLAKRYGYKNQVTMLKSLEKIQNDYEDPDFTEITRLQRIESRRILVPETSDDEISSLSQNYIIFKELKDMKFTSQEKKSAKIIRDYRPYSPIG